MAQAQDSRSRLALQAGQSRLTIPSDAVAEVIRSPRITRLPLSPAGVLGVSHLRGAVFPVLSLNVLIGVGEAKLKRLVVLRRDPPVGLAVEWVDTATDSDAADAADAAVSNGALMWVEDGHARRFDLDAALADRFAKLQGTARAPTSPPAPALQGAPADLAFMGVSLANQAYALPLDSVAEVARVPDGIASLPNTEEVLLGMLAVRGRVLAVVSLRALLGLPLRRPQPSDRLVVVRIGDHALALVVEGVSAIIRAPVDAPRPAPSLFNRGAGEAAIAQVLPTPDGQGLVSILDPSALLADHRLARLLAEPAAPEDQPMAQTATKTAERFLIVRLGQESYGLPIAAIDEVARLPDTLTRLPRAPAYVQGVMNLRGRVIPVIDQAQRFSTAGEDALGTRRVVVASFGALQAGFAVDAVSRIVEVDAADIQPAPALGEADQVIDRVARIEANGEVILLIDPKVLLGGAEADLLRQLTAKSQTS